MLLMGSPRWRAIPPRQMAAPAAIATQTKRPRIFTEVSLLEPVQISQKRKRRPALVQFDRVERLPVVVQHADVAGGAGVAAHQDDVVLAVGVAERAVLDAADLPGAVGNR